MLDTLFYHLVMRTSECVLEPVIKELGTVVSAITMNRKGLCALYMHM